MTGTTGPAGARRTVLVTGASAGIGEAFADVFAAAGYDLVLAARREDRLQAVAERIGRQYGRRPHVVVADLAGEAGPARLCETVAQRGLVIDALVNNAGYGMPGAYLKSSWPQHDAFLRVMVSAVAELTHRLLPGMVERRFGRIINVSSLAALVPAPAGHTLYAASKAFLLKFSEALALETRPHGVHVTALCPGFTYTEFHDVNGTRAKVSRMPSVLWMDAARVAHQGYAAVEAGTVVCVPGRLNTALAFLARVSPQRLVSAVNHQLAKSYRST